MKSPFNFTIETPARLIAETICLLIFIGLCVGGWILT